MGKTIVNACCCGREDCHLCLNDEALMYAIVTLSGITHTAGEDPCPESESPPCEGGDCGGLNGRHVLGPFPGITNPCCGWGYDPSYNDGTYAPCACGDTFELSLCCSEEGTLEWELIIEINNTGLVAAYIDYDQGEACEPIGDLDANGLPGVDCTEPLFFPEFLEYPMTNPPKILTCDFSNATATVHWEAAEEG